MNDFHERVKIISMMKLIEKSLESCRHSGVQGDIQTVRER